MTYEFLIEMGWKSALIAGAALLLAALLRSRSAADRGAVLKLAVALLLALPIVALAGPALQVETAAPAQAAARPAAASLPEASNPEPAASSAAILEPSADWSDPSLIFFLLYLGGLAMVGGRLGAGLWTLRRWTRDARDVESSEWRSALARAGGEALGLRLLVSDDISSPLSWGWRRPVILIDRDTLRLPGEAEAILAHEVAHVLRRDWPSLIASRLAVSLFWFNPLVWRLDREVAQQAEEAADSEAAAKVEPARYAQTLLDWARLSGDSAIPANAIAAGEPGLSRRVRAILDGRIGRPSGSGWSVAALLACAAFAAPVAAIEFVEAAPAAPKAPPAPLARVKPATPVSPPALPVPAAPAAPRSLSVPPAVPPVPATPAAEARVRAQAAARAAERPHVDGEAIASAVAEAMKSVEIATAEAERTAELAAEAAMTGIAHGATGMEAGAKGMERGAEGMRREARRLRERDYREAQIRKEAARGKHVTHEQLLDVARDLEEGAKDMDEGARDMREAAADMRREAKQRRH